MIAPAQLDALAVAVADQLADRLDLDTLADLIADRLGAEQPPARGMVDAATLAALLGCSRTTVYERADQLGAVRIGDGPRPRLRFDPDRARAALAGTTTPTSTPTPAETAARPRRRARSHRSRVLTPKATR